MTVARVYLEMGGFSRALEGLQGSHKIASGIGDPALELQVFVSLSELFGRLQDNEKSANYASKAYDISRSLQVRIGFCFCPIERILFVCFYFCLPCIVRRFKFITS